MIRLWPNKLTPPCTLKKACWWKAWRPTGLQEQAYEILSSDFCKSVSEKNAVWSHHRLICSGAVSFCISCRDPHCLHRSRRYSRGRPPGSHQPHLHHPAPASRVSGPHAEDEIGRAHV